MVDCRPESGLPRRTFIARGALGTAGILAAPLLAACGGDDDAAAGSGTLTFGLWPDFGLEPQEKQYQRKTGVKIKERLAEWSQHHTNLETALGAGKGAPDVAAIEATYKDRFYDHPNLFVDLKEYGAKKEDFLGYLWDAAAADSGAELGVPLDAPGPVVLAYRRDIFEKAGLPADRDELAGQITSWDALVDAGATIKAETGLALFGGLKSFFDQVSQQGGVWYFDTNDKLVVETNQDLERAWELCARLSESQAVLNLDNDTPEWFAALDKGAYAVQVLPSWMKAQIEEAAPDADGLWDAIPLPEGKGSAIGGTWLSVTTQAKDPKQAADFVMWFAAPEQQAEKFLKTGAWPGTLASYRDKRIDGFAPEYWNKAPLGRMWADAAEDAKAVYVGPDGGKVNDEFSKALHRLIDVKGEGADEIWANTVETIHRKVPDA